MSHDVTAGQVRRLATVRIDLLLWSTITWIGYFIPPLFIGWLTRSIFNHLTGDAATRSLWTLVGWLLAAQMSRELVQWIWISFNMRYFGHTEGLLRHNLFRNLIARPDISDRQPPGAIVAYMRADVENVSDIINEWYRLVGEGVFFVIALTIMITINPWVALLANLPLAVIAFVVHQLGTPLERRRQAERAATTRTTGFIGEICGAVLAVKVAGAEHAVGRQFHELNERRRHAALSYTLTSNIISAMGNNMVLVGRGLILLLVAYSVENGTIFTVGDFALFIIYLGWMLEFPRRVGRLLAIRRTGAVSGRRLLGLIDSATGSAAESDLFAPKTLGLEGAAPQWQAAVPIRPTAPLERLTVLNLSHTYPNSHHGIREVSFTLHRGQLMVITGPIGSGKTTLLKALLGLLPDVSGRIEWNGQAIDPQALTPPLAAYTPQVPRLFSDTLAANIRLGWPTSDAAMLKHLDISQLEQDIATFPDGLDTQIGVRGVRLSGGQAQRTAAARMLVRDADVMVIDDLSSALDVTTEATLWQHLRQQKHKTFLVVSHRPAILEAADHILVLQNGCLQAQGTYASLLREGILTPMSRDPSG